MGLSVDKKASQGSYNPKIGSVTTNSGMQGSTYNPQQTAPSTKLQNPATVNTYQNTATARQLQNAATQREIARVAEMQRQAAVAEAARQREIIRQQVQLKVDTTVNSKRTQLSASAASVKQRITPGKVPSYKIKLPEQSEYQKAYAKAYWEAMDEYDAARKPAKQNFFQKVADKVTFGQDTRDVSARRYAEKRINEIMDRDFNSYETKVNTYVKKQATAQEAINRAALTMSQPEFDKFVQTQQSQLDKEYNSLQELAARYDGMTAAFSNGASKKLTSVAARTVSKGAKFVSDQNPIWKFTLGSGSENIPSLVKAPARLFNFAGNINTKDRTIYEYGGNSFNRANSNKNAWQATFNQRNKNTRPWVDVKLGKQADQILGNEVKSLIATRKKMGVTDPDKLNYNKVMESRLRSYNESKRNFNSAEEIASDPLFFVSGAAKAASKIPGVSKFATAVKASKPAQFSSSAITKLKNSAVVQKLNAEYKAPSQRLFDTVADVRNESRAVQKQLLERLSALSKDKTKHIDYDLSIFDDLNRLSDSELKMLQRMTDGKLSFKDRALLSGRNYAPVRAKLADVAERYTQFTEKMRLADDVNTTRFGRGKKTYSPKTKFIDDLEDYNFRKFKKSKKAQSGEDFLHGVSDRFFKSDLEEIMSHGGKQHKFLDREINKAQSEYSDSFKIARSKVEQADKLYKRDATGLLKYARNKKGVRNEVSLSRAAFNSAKNVVSAPTNIWKKSVLKYRPAWYVNNILYNTQAAGLAGGSRAVLEQAKMLNPKYWRKAMDEVPASVRSNLSKEIGTGRVARFASNVENWSRVAAFRGAKARNLTDEQALKRVNNYLFDYSTKNWERPIKAVVPFWSFQKNIAKASAKMPFDRPGAAVAYNRLDSYQQQQFDKDFNKIVPELKKLNYSDEEIESFRADQAKYFRGRLKIGNKYITTPFNAFSEKQMSQFGLNPFLKAAQETADSEDSFGRPISGNESGFMRRVLSKFPQLELARQFKMKRDVDSGLLKPEQRYIGKPGSEGYGLGKVKQGYDSSKPNYVESLDPRRKFGQNVLAFAGVPRSLEFNKTDFVTGKKLQRVTQEYFNTDWKGMSWEDSQKAQQELFTKYGISSDEFYKGILSKYDSENAKGIKALKEDARAKNDSLLAEYGRQPYGTRAAWAAKKLKELVDSGYYKDNPFLYSFVKDSKNGKTQGFLTPETIAKSKSSATKKADYEYAIKTGDWSKWRAKYGVKQTAKSLARDKAVASGDWSAYRKAYGTKHTPFEYAGKFFKSQESMDKYKAGDFWKQYVEADKATRKKLLADNPQYDSRKGWTAKMWQDWKDQEKIALRSRASRFSNFSALYNSRLSSNKTTAFKFNASRGKTAKVRFNLS